jgi:hypothetical protein
MNERPSPERMAAADQRPSEQRAADHRKDRDAKGRFAAGNRGGPGNPFARHLAELRKELFDAAETDAVCDVARKMIERACSGDVAAAKLVLQYTLGRPAEMVDLDDVDLDEFD